MIPSRESTKGTSTFLLSVSEISPMRAGLLSVLFITETPAPSPGFGIEWDFINICSMNEWVMILDFYTVWCFPNCRFISTLGIEHFSKKWNILKHFFKNEILYIILEETKVHDCEQLNELPSCLFLSFQPSFSPSSSEGLTIKGTPQK